MKTPQRPYKRSRSLEMVQKHLKIRRHASYFCNSSSSQAAQLGPVSHYTWIDTFDTNNQCFLDLYFSSVLQTYCTVSPSLGFWSTISVKNIQFHVKLHIS